MFLVIINSLGMNQTKQPFSEQDLNDFLDWPEYKKWRGFVHLNKKFVILADKFFKLSVEYKFDF